MSKYLTVRCYEPREKWFSVSLSFGYSYRSMIWVRVVKYRSVLELNVAGARSVELLAMLDLWIYRISLTSHIWNKPEITANRFVCTPLFKSNRNLFCNVKWWYLSSMYRFEIFHVALWGLLHLLWKISFMSVCFSGTPVWTFKFSRVWKTLCQNTATRT